MERKTWLNLFILCGLLLALVGSTRAQGPEPQVALGTSFTYQGYLTDGESPADGTYDFRFILYNAEVGGAQVGGTLTRDNVPVAGGIFVVLLDFGGGPFDGDARYLETAVRAGSSTGPYTTLSPRQELTATPYALYALGAEDADTLDGQQGSFYRNASNTNAGTLDNARFSAVSDLAAEGYLGNASGDLAQNNGTLQSNLNADLLDGYHASQLASTATYAGGDQQLSVSSATIVRSVVVTAPSSGIVIVLASGYGWFPTTGQDRIRCSITTGSEIDLNYLTVAHDEYWAPFALTRGYTVGSGSYTFNLVCDGPIGTVDAIDTNIAAIFTPGAFGGAAPLDETRSPADGPDDCFVNGDPSCRP